MTHDSKDFLGNKVSEMPTKCRLSFLHGVCFSLVSFHPSNPFLDLSLGYIYQLGLTACYTVKTEPLIDPTLIELLAN